jgi:hypothetical protein
MLLELLTTTHRSRYPKHGTATSQVSCLALTPSSTLVCLALLFLDNRLFYGACLSNFPPYSEFWERWPSELQIARWSPEHVLIHIIRTTANTNAGTRVVSYNC